jgi:hypothetical protein
MYGKLDRPYSKCGYCGRVRNLWKPLLLFLQAVEWFSYRLFQECIWFAFIRIAEKYNVSV